MNKVYKQHKPLSVHLNEGNTAKTNKTKLIVIIIIKDDYKTLKVHKPNTFLVVSMTTAHNKFISVPYNSIRWLKWHRLLTVAMSREDCFTLSTSLHFHSLFTQTSKWHLWVNIKRKSLSRAEKTHKRRCALDDCCLLYVSTWGRRAPASIKRCICDILLYQKLTDAKDSSSSLWVPDHIALTLPLFTFQNEPGQSALEVCASRCHHSSTLVLTVSSAPFLLHKQPHVGFMPHVDMSSELPSLVLLSCQHQDIYFSCWCPDNMHKHQSRIKNSHYAKDKSAHNIRCCRYKKTADVGDHSRGRVRHYKGVAADEHQRAEEHAFSSSTSLIGLMLVVTAGDMCYLVKRNLPMSLNW